MNTIHPDVKIFKINNGFYAAVEHFTVHCTKPPYNEPLPSAFE